MRQPSKKPNVRPALTWWNKLSIPQKSKARCLCYPEQQSVYVSEKQITEMYSLRKSLIPVNDENPVTLNQMKGYQGFHHTMSSAFKHK